MFKKSEYFHFKSGKKEEENTILIIFFFQSSQPKNQIYLFNLALLRMPVLLQTPCILSERKNKRTLLQCGHISEDRNLQWTQPLLPNSELQELYYIALLFSLGKSGCWLNVRSDEQVVLVSSEPHQLFLGKPLLVRISSKPATVQIEFYWQGNLAGMGLKSPNSFPSMTSILLGAEVIGLCVCLSVCSASQSTDMPHASPCLFTAHCNLAEVHVINVPITWPCLLCVPILLFLTRRAVLY